MANSTKATRRKKKANKDERHPLPRKKNNNNKNTALQKHNNDGSMDEDHEANCESIQVNGQEHHLKMFAMLIFLVFLLVICSKLSPDQLADLLHHFLTVLEKNPILSRFLLNQHR